MKLKHNKKRNTAFLYEILVKECTKAIVRKNHERKHKTIAIIKEFFAKGTPLKKELDLYNMITDSKDLTSDVSRRLIVETKKDFLALNRKAIFNQQTKLIKRVNESLGKEAFANFIANYKSIATVGQFFGSSKENNAKQRILLEDNVMRLLTAKSQSQKQLKHVDNLTYKTFVDKFNETYKHTLKEEQKLLLTNYITSFADNGLGLKVFLNEEVGRLKKSVSQNINNKVYSEKFARVLKKLDRLKATPITEATVKEVFFIQDLLYEVNKNAS